MDRRIFLAGLIALPAASACRVADRREQALAQVFKWFPTESAPREAPAFVVNGDLRLRDGGTTYVPDKRIASKGWGDAGSLDIAGEEAKALPASVSLSWFSYLEDRFYAGEFALPADRMQMLFAHDAPMPAPSPPKPFDEIIFGMAPGGHVSVWASAGRVVREIATFRATPADLPWTEVIATPEPTRAEHIRQVLEKTQTPEQIALQRSPERLALWNDFPRRLPWAPQLTGVDPQGAILWIKGLNGEKDWADLADPGRGGEPLPPMLPMPASLTLGWRAGSERYSADIALDAAEVVAAFRKLADSERPGPLSLVLEPAGGGATVDLFLRRGELVYRFARTTVEIYGS